MFMNINFNFIVFLNYKILPLFTLALQVYIFFLLKKITFLLRKVLRKVIIKIDPKAQVKIRLHHLPRDPRVPRVPRESKGSGRLSFNFKGRLSKGTCLVDPKSGKIKKYLIVKKNNKIKLI